MDSVVIQLVAVAYAVVACYRVNLTSFHARVEQGSASFRCVQDASYIFHTIDWTKTSEDRDWQVDSVRLAEVAYLVRLEPLRTAAVA